MAKTWKVCRSKLKSMQASINRFHKPYLYLFFVFATKVRRRSIAGYSFVRDRIMHHPDSKQFFIVKKYFASLQTDIYLSNEHWNISVKTRFSQVNP